jgi:hypothetical protein
MAIEVNQVKRTVDVGGDLPLLWVLRDELNLCPAPAVSRAVAINSVASCLAEMETSYTTSC